jgi:uncharacterized repeat protein (TIGR01451 family)
MRNHIRYPLIAAILLLLSILLLPGISAARKGIKPTENDKSSWEHNLSRAGRFLLANLLEDDEPFADLIVTKTASSEQVSAGSDLTYTIEVRNGGPLVADNATLSDPLPPGMTFVSVTEPAGWSCSTPAVGAGGTVTCTNPSLAVTSGDVFTLIVNVPSNAEPGTFFTNTAKVSTTSLDPDGENNSSTAAVMLETGSGSVNVGVTKTTTSEQVSAGSDLTYTIEVRSSGPQAADNVTLSDTLPGNMTFVSVTEPAGWTCSTPAVGDGGTVTCTNPSLAVTSGDVFTLVVHIPSGTPPGTFFTNTAKVSTTTPDSNSEDNSSTISTEIASADLSVTKVDTPDPVTAGNNLTYTITVNNAGPSSSIASLSDTLPANTTFVSISELIGWSCITPAVGTGGTVSCFNPEFGKGSAVFTLKVATSPTLTAGTIISNTATVSSTTPDPNPGNESSTATTTVLSPANLSGIKMVSGQLTPGGNVTYTVVLANSGPAAQADNPGNELTDVLPAGLTLVSATATSGTATATVGTNTVTWNGVVLNGGSVTITIKATIKSGTEGITISNQGTINYDTDGNGTNETSALTDDPGVAGSSDPTSFVVNAAPTISINNVSITEGDSGTKDAVFTVTLSASSNQAVKVDYQTANGTATAPSDYQSASGTLTFNPGDITRTITVLINGDTLNEPDETFTVNLTNPQNATLASAKQGTGTILNDDSPVAKLGSNSYTASEAAGHLTITVTRTGDTSNEASVDYETSDLSGLNNCDVVTGNASQRCDYTAVDGILHFVSGQTSASFDIPIIDDVYVEGPETFTLTLSNPVGGINLGTPSTATLTITDNDFAPGAANPIDDDTFFIRQQYLDILGREPDPPGLARWQSFLSSCAAGSTACDRIELSSRFFRSAEFFERSYYVYRFYETALGRKPTYDEYQDDLKHLAGFLTDDELEQRKAQFAEDFSQRPEFKAIYDSKADGDEYVNAIVATAGVVPSNRTDVAIRQGALAITRGRALRELLESPEISAKFFNEAFVVVGYFAYLRREPDAQYLVWLNTLNTTGDYREMIRGFIESQEYRSRFGSM